MGLIAPESKMFRENGLITTDCRAEFRLVGSIGLNVWIPEPDRKLFPTNHLLHHKQKEQLHVEVETICVDSFIERKRASVDTRQCVLWVMSTEREYRSLRCFASLLLNREGYFGFPRIQTFIGA